MRTVRTKIYKFHELSEKAKDKAVENFLNSFHDSLAFDDTKEDAKEIGLKIICLDDHRQNEGEFMLAANEVAQNILNGHGETCDTYKTASKFMEEWQPVFNEYMNENSDKYESKESEEELQELEDDFLHDLLEDYRIMFNKQLDYENSDEFAIETIEANEYEFTEEGNIF